MAAHKYKPKTTPHQTEEVWAKNAQVLAAKVKSAEALIARSKKLVSQSKEAIHLAQELRRRRA